MQPGDFYCNGPHNKKIISLTFDDGPRQSTLLILDILAKYNVKATFFIEGSLAKSHSDILKKEYMAGHVVANHTQNHTNYWRYKKPDYKQKLKSEILETEKIIKTSIGMNPTYLRMPHGYVKSWVKEVAKETGYVIFNWSFGCDWNKMTSQDLAKQYIAHIQPGGILLFHDGGGYYKTLVIALPEIIEAINKKGYKIVPLEELVTQ
jgi:peptidoglycan/xylan/chitin deacetylase (PgdA/CDA1 family)